MDTQDEIRRAAKSLRKAERALARAMSYQEEKETPNIVPEVVRVNNAYNIGKYPITNGEYLDFVTKTGHRAPSHWVDGQVPEGKLRHPVVNVSYRDAVAYCKWLSSVSGRKFRLPTGDEWTLAAAGGDYLEYPWGNEKPNSKLCNFDFSVGDTTPVGSYPDGASPCGAQDMSGNVWEYTTEVAK